MRAVVNKSCKIRADGGVLNAPLGRRRCIMRIFVYFFGLGIANLRQIYYNTVVMALKTLYFDSFCGYTVSAVLENGKIVDFNFEKRNKGCSVGDIYKGRIESVLPGMRAAFVNCGLGKNCYLSADDYSRDEKTLEISDLGGAGTPDWHVGDELPVQIVKLPQGNKGAKVSAHLSFVGKTLIYLPDSRFVGISRKISDAELRKNLIYTAKKLISEGEGLIIRTAAPYARRRQMEQELVYLKNMYADVKKALKTAETGELLYLDFALPVRVLRDTLSTDISSIVVGNSRLAELIERVVDLYPPRAHRPVVVHDTGRDMMKELGIAEQIMTVTSPRVDLDNGAYIIIERTEALTVIDVNTGSFTGDDSLEQTVYLTNVTAAREIARQVRLRNIGGIVVVDFIDMQLPEHKKAVVEELERALKTDRVKCAVSPMSRLGLVEFTRKRTGNSTLSLMSAPCKRCHGSGTEPAAELVIIGLRAKLMDMFADGAKDVRVDMNIDVFYELTAWKEMRENLNFYARGAKIYAVPHRTYAKRQLNVQTAPFKVPYDAVEI